MQEKTLFMLARKKIKYPAMNLMGNVQKLYKENF